jgi:hypothetical protein
MELHNSSNLQQDIPVFRPKAGGLKRRLVASVFQRSARLPNSNLVPRMSTPMNLSSSAVVMHGHFFGLSFSLVNLTILSNYSGGKTTMK